jgi:hypothetical protein
VNRVKPNLETIPETGELPLLLDEKRTAKLIGVSVSFLRKARSEGLLGERTPAPEFVCVGGRRLYRLDDLQKWVSSLESRTAI